MTLESHGANPFWILTSLKLRAKTQNTTCYTRNQEVHRPPGAPGFRPPVLELPLEPKPPGTPQEPGPGPPTEGAHFRVQQPAGRIPASPFAGRDLGPLTDKPSGLSDLSLHSPAPAWAPEPGAAAAAPAGLSLGEWEPAGTLRGECGRRGRRRACRSDSSAPRWAWEACRAGRARGLSHPPGRACPPAGFLQSRAGEEGRRGGARGLAGLVPGFLSPFPERDRRGMGPSTNLLPGERGQEIASLLTQVPPLRRKVPTAIHKLSVLRNWV